MVPENLQRVFYKLLAVFALLLLNVDVNSQHALQPIQNNLSMKLGGRVPKNRFQMVYRRQYGWERPQHLL